MKKFFSLITALVLCTAMWGQTSSAYYEVPAGTFFAGMTDNSGKAASEFYVPYRHNYAARDTFRSAVKGTWKSSTEKSGQYIYTYSNVIDWYHIPQLQVEGKKNYQYGASSETYNSDLYFYIGYPDMHYMTPARLWTDLVTKSTGYQDGYGDKYKTTASDTMGVYFNNIETMYIDGISIPIALSSATKEVEVSKLFTKENSHVKVAIYKAEINGDEKSFERTQANTIWDSTLTVKDFEPYASDKHYRGALNANFAPITIDGAFVIELSEMKTSGCVFYVFSDKSNGKNKLGYSIIDGVVNYPPNYCLAVSVHAMFPVLEKKDTKTAFEFAHTGGDDDFAFISNVDPTSDDFTIDLGADWISKKDITYSKGKYELEQANKDTITYAFTVAPNTGAAREATITLKHHLKEVTYTVSQEAAAPAPEVTYYAKNNWDGATEWSWLEMSATDQENIYMLDSVVFGGTGVNINDKEDDTDALSFDTDKIVVLDDLDGLPGPIPPEPRKRDTIPYAPRHSGVVLEAPQLLAGDTIKLFFNAADSTLKAFIIGRPAPVIEYKYTTYTEWQVKQDETSPWGDMTKQEDGMFTFASVWYNLGLYIASGENPIKQGWYPLDDAALTIAEDVAELDNVVITLTVVNDETVALNVKKQTATSIDNVKAAQGQRYNILGQQVDANYRGIVIMNGKTFIQ